MSERLSVVSLTLRFGSGGDAFFCVRYARGPPTEGFPVASGSFDCVREKRKEGSQLSVRILTPTTTQQQTEIRFFYKFRTEVDFLSTPSFDPGFGGDFNAGNMKFKVSGKRKGHFCDLQKR
jgi:hypothetical protein